MRICSRYPRTMPKTSAISQQSSRNICVRKILELTLERKPKSLQEYGSKYVSSDASC